MCGDASVAKRNCGSRRFGQLRLACSYFLCRRSVRPGLCDCRWLSARGWEEVRVNENLKIAASNFFKERECAELELLAGQPVLVA